MATRGVGRIEGQHGIGLMTLYVSSDYGDVRMVGKELLNMLDVALYWSMI